MRESDQYGNTKIQNELLDLLKDFDSFCKKNNIVYSLSAGTLLGAIRHNGFIPWDDDIDIMMDRKNYKLFEQFWENYNDIVVIREMWIKKLRRISTGINGLISIDILVVDECPVTRTKRRIKLFLVKMLQGMMHIDFHYKKSALSDSIKLLVTYLLGKLFTYNFKFNLYHKVSQMWTDKAGRAQSCSIYNDIFQCLKFEFDADLMEKVEPHVFEDTMLPIISKWDHFLKVSYGDYMTPPPMEERIPIHK